MITISLCMIVKNEASVIARCLDSMKDVADEIIVVDTGSTDTTREIVSRYTEKQYEETWRDDFAAVRNLSFSKATMDYCMWLDADDVITEESREQLKQLKQMMNPHTDIVMMKYFTAFDEMNHPVFFYYRERLIKNHSGFIWSGRVHEAITLSGQILYLDIAIEHRKSQAGDPDRNLHIYETMLADGECLEPRQKFYYARELYDHKQYEAARKELEKYLDEDQGWVENKIEACRDLSLCYESLGEKQKALRALFRSLEYDRPRAEICCEIGHCFMGINHWHTAIYWYERALESERQDQSGGFVREDDHEFLPNLQLCVCYDRLGDSAKSYEYHKKTLAQKPNAIEVQQNELYFSEKNWE